MKAFMQKSFSISLEIRLFDLSDTFTERYTETFKRYFGGLKKLIIAENLWQIFFTAIHSGVNCYLFLYVAQRVYQGLLQIGDYSLYTGALNSISNGISQLISISATIYEGTSKLPPASYLIWKEGREPIIERYWRAEDVGDFDDRNLPGDADVDRLVATGALPNHI